MASESVFQAEDRRQRRRRLFARLQTGFTALLTLFFMGVSAWSINSIVMQNRNEVPAAQQPAPAAASQEEAAEPAPAPRRSQTAPWILNAPQ